MDFCTLIYNSWNKNKYYTEKISIDITNVGLASAHPNASARPNNIVVRANVRLPRASIHIDNQSPNAMFCTIGMARNTEYFTICLL